MYTLGIKKREKFNYLEKLKDGKLVIFFLKRSKANDIKFTENPLKKYVYLVLVLKDNYNAMSINMCIK